MNAMVVAVQALLMTVMTITFAVVIATTSMTTTSDAVNVPVYATVVAVDRVNYRVTGVEAVHVGSNTPLDIPLLGTDDAPIGYIDEVQPGDEVVIFLAMETGMPSTESLEAYSRPAVVANSTAAADAVMHQTLVRRNDIVCASMLAFLTIQIGTFALVAAAGVYQACRKAPTPSLLHSTGTYTVL